MDKLPVELLVGIIKLSASDIFRYMVELPNRAACCQYARLCSVSKRWCSIARALLYETVSVSDFDRVQPLLLRTLQNERSLAELVKGIEVDAVSPYGSPSSMIERKRNGVIGLMRACPELERADWNFNAPTEFAEVLLAAPKLRVLSLGNITRSAASTIQPLEAISTQVEDLAVYGTAETEPGTREIEFPRLRDLSYLSDSYEASDPFCKSLESLVNLEINIRAMSQGFSQLLSTIKQLRSLCLELPLQRSLLLPTIVGSLAENTVHSLFLKSVETVDEVQQILNEPAMKSLQKLRIHRMIVKLPIGHIDTMREEVNMLCEKRGVAFLGFCNASDFWKYAECES